MSPSQKVLIAKHTYSYSMTTGIRGTVSKAWMAKVSDYMCDTYIKNNSDSCKISDNGLKDDGLADGTGYCRYFETLLMFFIAEICLSIVLFNLTTGALKGIHPF